MNPEFFTLHKDLPREGPGEPEDVLWAIGVAGTRGGVSVLDAACGPGADTVTLATALPEATITAVDWHEGFVGQAKGSAAKFGSRVIALRGDMYAQTGPFDLIWCAGAVYFNGVSGALTTWRSQLAPQGCIAFSDAVWLAPERPSVVEDFWTENVDMTDIGGTRARISDAGFTVLGERILSASAWANYYDPMEERIARVRTGQVGPDLAEVLAEAETEIAMSRQYLDTYGYALFVVAPT